MYGFTNSIAIAASTKEGSLKGRKHARLERGPTDKSEIEAYLKHAALPMRSEGTWIPKLNLVWVTFIRGNVFRAAGHMQTLPHTPASVKKVLCLYAEEAALLVESSRLALHVVAPSDASDEHASMVEALQGAQDTIATYAAIEKRAIDASVPLPIRARPVRLATLEECFALLTVARVPMQCYFAYRHLRLTNFNVMRRGAGRGRTPVLASQPPSAADDGGANGVADSDAEKCGANAASQNARLAAFDCFRSSASFRKSAPGVPDFAIAVFGFRGSGALPSVRVGALRDICDASAGVDGDGGGGGGDAVPIKCAIVDGTDVSLFSLSLPPAPDAATISESRRSKGPGSSGRKKEGGGGGGGGKKKKKKKQKTK